MKRRILLAAAIAAPLAYIAAKKPRAHSGAHDAYFLALQAALGKAGLFKPTLVIDREKLAFNIGRLKAHLPKNKHFRLVSKSVPSLKLIEEIRAATGTNRLMTFHQPHMNVMARAIPDAQMLLGKPMPVGAAQRFFNDHKPNDFDPARQIEWLVDTPQRLSEYRELAAAQFGGKAKVRINLEIDVGLHRGGFASVQDTAEAVRQIVADPKLEFSGFMGYEPHAAKVPDLLGGPRGAIAKAMAHYSECLKAAQEVLGAAFKPEALTLNTAGSPTYQYYDESGPCNELSVGSALVKPAEFDMASLADHIPASFIATPVLKALPHNPLPIMESATALLRAWDPNTEQSFFIYGGRWLAQPVSPPGLQPSALHISLNQEMYCGSADVQLTAGDFIFFRPYQSEFVFLQFGDIAVYEGGEIVDYWAVFPEGDVV